VRLLLNLKKNRIVIRNNLFDNPTNLNTSTASLTYYSNPLGFRILQSRFLGRLGWRIERKRFFYQLGLHSQ
jgi:hypothetical protein